MRRVVFSLTLVGALLVVIASGPVEGGASTVNTDAQLHYSTSTETLQNLGAVNLSAIAGASAASITAKGSSSSSSLNHVLPPDTVLRPTVKSSATATVSPGSLLTVSASPNARVPGFEGISGPQQAAVNGGGDLEPPDQGTCAGPDTNGNPIVVEIINNALAAYTPTGGEVLPVTATYALFNQSSTAFLSDPRCAYDPITKRWFFTEFVVGSAKTHPHFAPSTQFIAVSQTSNPLGSYQVFGIDTTDLNNPAGDCPCFGDFDQIGLDANGLYISTNEFSTGGTAPYFNGTVMYAMSNQSLAAAAGGAALPTVQRYAITGDSFGTSGGNQPYHVAPASTPPDGGFADNTEYFVESNSNAYADSHLIVYALTDTNLLANGGTPTLQATEITSEPYAFPPNASQAAGPIPLGNQIGRVLGPPFFDATAPQGIQTDFNAIQGVTYTNGSLYAELDTATGSGSSATSAAGWFRIQPSVSNGVSAQIANQGYVATSQNIMYPEIVVGPSGKGYLAFSISGSGEYPSAAYTAFSATSGPVGPVIIESPGSAPEDGFTCYISGYGGCRWGDYTGGAVWNGQAYLMTEYIPPSSQRDFFTNWGTYVWSGSTS